MDFFALRQPQWAFAVGFAATFLALVIHDRAQTPPIRPDNLGVYLRPAMFVGFVTCLVVYLGQSAQEPVHSAPYFK